MLNRSHVCKVSNCRFACFCALNQKISKILFDFVIQNDDFEPLFTSIIETKIIKSDSARLAYHQNVIQLQRPSTIFPTISLEIKLFLSTFAHRTCCRENCWFSIEAHLNNYDTFTSELTDQISIEQRHAKRCVKTNFLIISRKGK